MAGEIQIVKKIHDLIDKLLGVNYNRGLGGSGNDITFTLMEDNTPYAIPPNPPDNFYTLVIYNASDTNIYFRFTAGITAGVKIVPGASLSIDLGPNQQVYVYCTSPGKTINLSYKVI